jgi:subtilisin family serine protease
MFPSRRAASRRAFILLATLLAAGIFVLFGRAQAPAGQAQHVLVKINSSLAKDVESALPMQTMELVAGSSGNARVEAFLSKYAAHKLRPVYPNIVRSKKQNGFTDLQIATAIQRKFAKRASRLHASFRPPEISRTYVLEFDAAARLDLQATLKSLSADADVEFVEQDHLASTNFAPNDPYFSSSGSWGQAYDDLWGIKKIGAPAAWDTTAAAGVVVAVVDTGIDYNHPDIAANIWMNPGEIPNNGIDDDNNGYIDDVRGWDFIGHTYTNPTQSNNPIDHFGHGTHVAGTIAAIGNNGIGVIGVAWQAKVMAVKGLDDNGNGLDSTLGPAIIYAANNGADVISNSWAGSGTSQTIAQAIDYAHSLGAVIVAAAGNSRDDARNYYPANVWDAITVSATDHNDSAAYFSNYGSKIDVAAPGVDILSLRAAGTSMGTPVDANYTRADGTSMATPHVSGLAALILAQNPVFSNEDVRQALRHTATIPYSTNTFDINYGYGRINGASAISISSVLESKISSPVDGTTVATPTVISGYARGTGFASYALQYGSGTNPSSWTTFQTGTSPVAGTTLGTFDPTIVPDGVYTIQLVAYDLSNNAYVDHIQLTVKYVSITVPAVPAVPIVASEFKPGFPISVTGTAGGPSFSDFRLEWAEGINPSSGWSSSGISLTNGGTTPVSNGLVGTWNPPGTATADYYTVRLSVDNAGFTSHASTLVYLEPSLLSPNWPISLNQAPDLSSGIVPALDASNNIRLVMVNPSYAGTGLPAQFWSISADGSSQNVSQIQFGDVFQPAVGSFDGTPGQQAIVGEGGDLHVFRADNSSYTLLPMVASSFEYTAILLEDLNNDSHLEAIALGQNSSGSVAYVHAWRADGTQLNANFPITVPNQNTDLTYFAEGPRVLAADINGDGYKELVVSEGTSSNTFALGLFAHDGTPLTWSAPSFSGVPRQFAFADLDHNGKLETILVTNTGSQIVTHVLQPDGTERAGWPVIMPSTSGFTSIAVGNLSRDGRDQIVISCSNFVSILNPDGTSFSPAWPLVGSGFTTFGPAVLADIDGDGRPEIIFSRNALASSPVPLLTSVAGSSLQTSVESSPAGASPQIRYVQNSQADGMAMSPSLQKQSTTQSFYGYAMYFPVQLIALHADGSLVRSWSLPGIAGNQPDSWATVTVGDFNQDGLTDIGVVYLTISGGGTSGSLSAGVATVLTTGTPFNSAANDWPMILQNPQNTAVYRPLLNVSVSSPTANSNVNGVVPLAANATDKVATPSVQFQVDGANVGAPINSAPYTLSWDTSTVALGAHVITALASDSANNTAVSLPVTINVVVPPRIVASPTSINFGNAIIGSGSAAQTITITNVGQAAYTLSTINLSGDFTQTSNCIGPLAAGASCSITVTFTPTIRGPETGSLSVSGNFPGPGPTVALSGTGQALSASLSPSSLTFQSRPINSTSASQTMTYSNTADVAVSISAIVASGDFAQTNTCGSSLAAGTSCSISVTFTPTARGTRTGSITVSGNVNTSASLTGTGQAMLVNISPSTLAFGNQLAGTTSAAQTVTVSNIGDLPFSVDNLTYGNPFTVTATQMGDVWPGAALTFSVTFTPPASGPYQANFIINGTFPNAPTTIPMTGTGYTLSAAFSPSALTFGAQRVGTSSTAQNVILTNTGSGSLSLTGFSLSGDFARSNNCPANLGAGASCSVSVTFHPAARGTRTGVLTLNSNATGAPPSVSLSGTGIAPIASLSPTSLTFASQKVTTTSSAQKLTLSNSGDATLDLTSVVASGDFAQTNTCTATLAVGASCTINVTLTPTTAGTRTGALTVTDDASNGSPQSASLSGTGVDFSLSSSPASVSVTAGNAANYTITVSALGGTYNSSVSLACSAGLPKGTNCSFSPGSPNPGSTSANSTLKISTSKGNNGTPPGSYVITVRGTSGSDQHTTTVTLQVN